MSTPAPPLTPAQNPWPGISWYTEEQAHLFFGREAETQELLRFIQRDTLTVLFGRSGLGKTSLLRAGVFPLLRLAGHFPVVLKFDYLPQARSAVEQVKTITEEKARESGIDVESGQEPAEHETLWEYFHRVHFWGPRNDRLTPVLVFDQFEEIFTLGGSRQQDSDIFEQLADLAENRIPAAVRQRAEAPGQRQSVEAGVPNYKIVLSLREDFVWRLDTLRPILPAIMRNRFALGPLDAARGLEIIRNSGKQWVTDEVAQDIIDAVISSRRGEGVSTAAEEVEPAYLNVMCNELFERMLATGQTGITRALVAAEKGGILERFYERSLSGLSDSVRLFVEQNLVTPAGFRATMPVEEARREHISDKDLDELVDRRLLRYEDRLGTRHVELAHDLLTGLVQKSRERREQAQLRRQLRLARTRTAIWATVVLLGIAGSVFYWLGWVHPSTSYYARFLRTNGSYKVAGPLSKNEVTHRDESLKVTRKGFWGEILAVEAINGYGQLIMDSQLDQSVLFPTSGVEGQFCRLEFTYDEKGQAVHEVALDMQGRMVYALSYAPTPADLFMKVGNVRNTRLFSVAGADGTAVSSGDVHYDAQGYVSEVQFFTGGGTPEVHGAYIIDTRYTKLGLVEEDYLDKDRNPVAANKGFAGITYSLDARGDVVEELFHDLNGKPVSSPDGGPPIARWQYDNWGNQTESSNYDDAGKPASREIADFQKAVYILDDHGSLKEERFFGPDGQPVADSPEGCYAYARERDQHGIITAKGCLDAQGKPMNQLDTGYQKIAVQYDSSEREVGRLYYDRDGKPVADKRTVSKTYFDEYVHNGKPAAYRGCFGMLWEYDASFQIAYPVCLDANGNAYDLVALEELATAAHEVSLDFARSFVLFQQVVAQDPAPSNRLNLEEAALTANRFDVCLQQAALVQDSQLTPSEIVARDVVRLTCQFAVGSKADARATAASLMGRVNQMAAKSWISTGTRYYIQTSPPFQAGSGAWDQLFASLEKGDGKGAADALRQLQAVLKD